MPIDETREIVALLRRHEEAVARGDAAGAVASFADGAVVYDLPPPLEYRVDAAQLTTGLNEWFATWAAGVTTELSEPTILVEGELAVVFGLSRMRGTKKDEGPIDSWNRRTIVLRRSDGGWRIVHEHSSYPMAMDGSGKALTALQPGVRLMRHHQPRP